MRTPVAKQAARSTPMSNRALWATTGRSPIAASRSSSCSAQPSAPTTWSGVIPWIRMFHSLNTSCPAGGRISQPTRSTTRPSSTATTPTEQADAAEGPAVSKSIAAKSSGTNGMLAAPSDTAVPPRRGALRDPEILPTPRMERGSRGVPSKISGSAKLGGAGPQERRRAPSDRCGCRKAAARAARRGLGTASAAFARSCRERSATTPRPYRVPHSGLGAFRRTRTSIRSC